MSTTAVQPIVRILGISGSLQTASNNTKLLHAARGLARPGVRFEVWSGLAAVPPFNEDDEDEAAEPVHTLRDTIAAADAVLIATPEYNNSVPGQLKNAVDWASRPYGHGVLRAKPIAVVGASPSPYGAAWAQAELRKSLASAGASVLDRELCVARVDEAFGPDGRLRHPELEGRLQNVLDELARVPHSPATAA